MTKSIQIITLAVVLCLTAAEAYAQGAGIEWERLNRVVVELYRAGKYDDAVAVAKKALEIAEENVGPGHPNVAMSLNNLALLYRATGRIAEAERLEERAARIRAIKR